MCREAIPLGFLDRPGPLNLSEIKKTYKSSLWFYEAKNGGWWLYEHRVAEDIEKAFSDKKEQTHVEISGFPYTVDFVDMVQYRKDRPNRKRKIKRDGVREESVKGVAGICIEASVCDDNDSNLVDYSAPTSSDSTLHC